MEPLLQNLYYSYNCDRPVKKRWTKNFCNFSHLPLLSSSGRTWILCASSHMMMSRWDKFLTPIFYISFVVVVVVAVCGRKWNLEWFMFNCFVDNFFFSLVFNWHHTMDHLHWRKYCVKVNDEPNNSCRNGWYGWSVSHDTRSHSFHFSIVIKEALLNGYWYAEWRPQVNFRSSLWESSSCRSLKNNYLKRSWWWWCAE